MIIFSGIFGGYAIEVDIFRYPAISIAEFNSFELLFITISNIKLIELTIYKIKE